MRERWSTETLRPDTSAAPLSPIGLVLGLPGVAVLSAVIGLALGASPGQALVAVAAGPAAVVVALTATALLVSLARLRARLAAGGLALVAATAALLRVGPPAGTPLRFEALPGAPVQPAGVVDPARSTSSAPALQVAPATRSYRPAAFTSGADVTARSVLPGSARAATTFGMAVAVTFATFRMAPLAVRAVPRVTPSAVAGPAPARRPSRAEHGSPGRSFGMTSLHRRRGLSSGSPHGRTSRVRQHRTIGRG